MSITFGGSYLLTRINGGTLYFEMGPAEGVIQFTTASDCNFNTHLPIGGKLTTPPGSPLPSGVYSGVFDLKFNQDYVMQILKLMSQRRSSFPLNGWNLQLLWVEGLLIFLILLTFTKPDAYGQPTLKDDADAPLVTYEEIPVRLMIEGYKMFYIDAIYGNNKQLFVNVEDLFNTLDIQCIAGKDGNSLSGFIEKESQIYAINLNTKEIKVGSKIICTKNGFTYDQGALYIESSLFAEAFGITLSFNYRAITIQLRSNFELPILKQMHTEKLRKNV